MNRLLVMAKKMPPSGDAKKAIVPTILKMVVTTGPRSLSSFWGGSLYICSCVDVDGLAVVAVVNADADSDERGADADADAKASDVNGKD